MNSFIQNATLSKVTTRVNGKPHKFGFANHWLEFTLCKKPIAYEWKNV